MDEWQSPLWSDMKLIITRTWEPVTKTVTECQECPWFVWEKDGQATLPMCQHPKYSGGVIYDELVISDLCPERPKSLKRQAKRQIKTKKIFVGDDDHDPDHKWEITVPA